LLINKKEIIKIFGLSVGRAMYLRAHKLNLHKTLVPGYIPVIRKGQPTEQYCQMVHFNMDELISSYINNVDPRYAKQCAYRAKILKQYKESK